MSLFLSLSSQGLFFGFLVTYCVSFLSSDVWPLNASYERLGTFFTNMHNTRNYSLNTLTENV
jgi:hypothetical protein